MSGNQEVSRKQALKEQCARARTHYSHTQTVIWRFFLLAPASLRAAAACIAQLGALCPTAVLIGRAWPSHEVCRRTNAGPAPRTRRRAPTRTLTAARHTPDLDINAPATQDVNMADAGAAGAPPASAAAPPVAAPIAAAAVEQPPSEAAGERIARAAHCGCAREKGGQTGPRNVRRLA